MSHRDFRGGVACRHSGLRLLGAAVIAIALTACGGGGGGSADEPLEVELAYSLSGSYEVWVPVESQATINGLDGHTPQCSLSGGSLPDGVQVNGRTCAVEGTPNETGTFPFTTRLTVSGFSGYVEASGTLRVVGPYFTYSFGPEGFAWGEPFRTTEPSYGNFWPSDADQVTYRLGDDAPAWVAIDPDTGALFGTPMGASGSHDFTVYADIVHDGHSLTTQSSLLGMNVNYPGIHYQSDNYGDVGVALTLDPQIPTGFQTGFTLDFTVDPTLTNCELPAGLSLDAKTGRISGTPTQTAFECDVAVAWTAEDDSNQFGSFDILRITIR